ncbi:MAG TPA: hypothetical protein VH877_20485 [Polyangia bacterium]|nr:hypothetical protein [Polyangia bacterium]
MTPALARWRRWLRRLMEPFTAGDRVLGALVLGIVIYYCATPGIFEGKASGDGLRGFFYLPGVIYHHTLDMEAPARALGGAYVPGREVTGRAANPCPIGPVLLWMPSYLLGLGIKQLAVLGVPLPRDWLREQSSFDFWMAALGSLGAGLAGLGTLFRLVRRHLGVAAARFGTVGAAVATPLVWYLVHQPLYQHACAFWAVTLFCERWDAWRGQGGEQGQMTWGRWAGLGALGGLALLMRLQEGIWLLLPGLDVLGGLVDEARGARRGRVLLGWIGRGLLCVGVAALVFLPQLLLWYWYFGAVRPPQPPGHMRWGDPGLLATIWSMRGGLLTWSPILYLGLPGLWLARRQLGGLAWRLGLVLAVEWWVNAAAWDHWASWTFGARRFTDATVVFAVGLGGCWVACTAAGRRRIGRGLWAVLLLAVAWNGLLMELVRQRYVKSSGAGAYAASDWVRWAKGPAWLGQALDRFGFPFNQPAGWIYAWIYGVPPATYDGVVGSYMLERDWFVHDVIHVPGFAFEDGRAFVVGGVVPPPPERWPRGTAVPASGPRLRVLVPLVGREPVRVRLTGDFGARAREMMVRWNDAPLPVTLANQNELRFAVPVELVHTRARANVLVIDGVPPGSRFRRLDFESFTRWWQ